MANAVVLLCLLVLNCKNAAAVVLDDAAQEYNNNILQEFEKNPRSGWFDGVVEPPVLPGATNVQLPQHSFLPKLFVWAPLEHFGINLHCPEHGGVLKSGAWMNVVNKKSFRNPRLVYGLGGNVVLVQKLYVCSYPGFYHRYLSASETLMKSMPQSISSLLPFKLYYRSCCTKEILSLVETLVLEGVNFLQISNMIAAVNYKAFSESSFSASTSNDFYDDMMSSFPSDKHASYLHVFRALPGVTAFI